MKNLRFLCLFAMVASSVLLAQTNPVPFVNQPLVPMTAPPGTGGLTLTINGAGFVPGSVVNWNGAARTTTFVRSTRLTASITAADLATAGTAAVTVVNPAGGGGISNRVDFAVTTVTLGPLYIESDLSNLGYASVAADFDGDGKLDLAAAVNASPGTVLVRLGNGDGTFQADLVTSTTNMPYAMAVSDFNHDNKADLVTANLNGTMSILLGNGNGTFQVHVDYPAKPQTRAVAVGDFNGDGNTDVVVANGVPNGGVSVFLGRGDGSFQPQVAYAAGSTPFAVAVADFNNDNLLDLAVANTGSQLGVSILLGNGDGTFQHPVTTEVSPAPSAVVAADFNNDGNVDVALAESNKVAILLGNGHGALGTPFIKGATTGLAWLVAADFNGDGMLDVGASGTSKQIAVLFGTNDGQLLVGPPRFEQTAHFQHFEGVSYSTKATCTSYSSTPTILLTSLSPEADKEYRPSSNVFVFS